jgi:hypothetical protein
MNGKRHFLSSGPVSGLVSINRRWKVGSGLEMQEKS